MKIYKRFPLMTLAVWSVTSGLTGELWGTYCYREQIFSSSGLPFHLFCVTLTETEDREQENRKNKENKSRQKRIEAGCRFSTRSLPDAPIAAPKVRLKWEEGKLADGTTKSLVVDTKRLEHGARLLDWIKRVGALLKVGGAIGAQSIRMYPTSPVGNTQLIVDLGGYRLVLGREESLEESGLKRKCEDSEDLAEGAPLAKACARRRVEAGLYQVRGQPSECRSITVQVGEDDGSLVATFTFVFTDGLEDNIDHMKLKGKSVLRVDRRALDAASMAALELQVWILRSKLNIGNLTMDTIAIENYGDDRILLHLGKTAIGSPAESGVELFGTYCHNKEIFIYPKLPFDSFCLSLNKRQAPVGADLPQRLPWIEALFRYTTTLPAKALVYSPRIPFKWDKRELANSSMNILAVDLRRLEHEDELSKWLSKVAELLGQGNGTAVEGLRIYPKLKGNLPSGNARLTLSLVDYHLVLDRVDEDIIASERSIEGRVRAGTYRAYGHPNNYSSTTVDIRERREGIEASITFVFSDGSAEKIGYVKLKGDRVMKVDQESVDFIQRITFKLISYHVRRNTNIRNLTLSTIAIAPNGENQILLYLGEAHDGSPAAMVSLPRVS
ncbi:hypothetical protein FOZ63_006764 [Perkinsus olseni]|uniref:PDZ domain-containing protein n=1 Tax=Perkinsus olseni TaxID=32597 RepID=A0A7J6T491_PEROL|nr:hypothetical protein FOZ63_006764 [Perkinsus olseni]KAF4739226.1 hypothetical protein FOZ62_022860 [Perkinsus olseni]